MGYRNYLYVADKKLVRKIKKMNREELFSFTEETPESDEEDYYFGRDYPYRGRLLDKIGGVELIELGKYIDFSSEIEPFLKPLFKDKEINKYYNEETDLYLADFGILQKLATIYKEKVKKYYFSLLEEKSPDEFDKRTQIERLIENVKYHLIWSEYLDRLPRNQYSICGCDLYEHEIFNFLHFMRVINPKKQCLIYTGY